MSEVHKDLSADNNVDALPDQQQEQEVESKEGTSKKQTFKEKLDNLPASINTAIDEGKGNTFIEAVQNIIGMLITAIFSSGQQAAVQLYLLSAEQKKKVTKIIYAVALICALGSCISLIFSFSLENIIFALCFILGAYLADIIVQTTSSKSKTKKKSKSKSASRLKADQDVDDGDIL